MALIKWDPFPRLWTLTPWFEEEEGVVPTTQWRDVCVWESDKEVTVEAVMPGVDPKEIKVKLVGDQLIIEAEHEEKKTKAKGKKVAGRAWQKFSYRFQVTLPAAVDQKGGRAEYKNGVLRISLPKEKAEVGGKTIPVKG